MSIAFDGITRIRISQLSRDGMAYNSVFDSPETGIVGVKDSGGGEVMPEELKTSNSLTTLSSSSSSSIGRNSDVSDRSLELGEDGGENEVQSSYKGPLDMMESLEEVLPIRRGISKFYNGKSKSFTSLIQASASTSSIKDISKPETAFTRKRKNLIAFDHTWGNNRTMSRLSSGGGIAKRPIITSSRSTLALGVAMSSSESISSEDSYGSENNSLGSLSPTHCNISTWRSYSVSNLQQCTSPATIAVPSSFIRHKANVTRRVKFC